MSNTLSGQQLLVHHPKEAGDRALNAGALLVATTWRESFQRPSDAAFTAAVALKPDTRRAAV